MKIVVWSEHSLYGGAAFLIEGIRKGHEAHLCCLNKEPYNYGPEDNEIVYWRKDKARVAKLIDEADALIVVATISLRYLMEIVGFRNLRSKPIAIVIGDSHYCNNNKFFNNIFRENGLYVFMMTDKYHFCDDDIKLRPYFPPAELGGLAVPKFDRLTVTHLPGTKYELNEKGTKELIELFKKIEGERSDVDLKVHTKLNWKECIKIKAQSHIFVDQIIKNNKNAGEMRYKSGLIYEGGLGKSGLEGMLAGTLTIASGSPIDTEPYFPKPPVVWADYFTIEAVLKSWLDFKAVEEKAQEQLEWAKAYINPDFVAEYILREMEI